MRYSCPSDEEIAAYGRFPGIRRVLEQHASSCPECTARIRPVRTKFCQRRASVLLCLVMALAGIGFCLRFPQSTEAEISPVAQRSQQVAIEVPPPTIMLNGHVFQGNEATQIRASFKTSGVRPIGQGDTLGKIARQAYGAVNEDLWEALVEYNNHPDNENRFASRYGRPLDVKDLPVGSAIQVPPQQILMLIFHRVEVADASLGR